MKASKHNLGEGCEPMRSRVLWQAALLALTACLAAVGCETGDDAGQPDPTLQPPMEAMGVDLRPDDTSAVAGQSVVLTVHADESIMYRDDAKVQWEAAGGEVSVIQPNRIARVRFEEPGDHRVTATLIVGGETIASDTTSVRVRPVQ